MKIYISGYLQKNPRLVSIINFFITLLVIFAILFLVRHIVSISLSPQGKVARSEKKVPKVPDHNLKDYAPILRNNPFGFSPGEIKPIASSNSSMSRLDIFLIGTISGARRKNYAIFMNKDGQQEVFRVGDSVFNLGILKKVEKERVFISVNGKDTEIPFADIATIKEVKVTETTSSPGFAKRIGGGTYVIDQRMVQKALERPNEIMTDARLLPNFVEGRQEGFTLKEVKPGGIYQNLGLQNGDILLRINEYAISNPEAALQAFTALKGMDRVQLDIIRSGTKMTMTYQIR
ncbi:MAG: type II secretion system protein N [Nitrospirota bacterium]